MVDTSKDKSGAAKPPAHPWVAKDPHAVPGTSQAALRHAMTLEGQPDSAFGDLLWIMAQESGFQLLKAQYHFNPSGEASFGNAVEEAQGSIRYIVDRYKSAAAARQFWEAHHWY